MATEHWFRWHHGTVTDPKWKTVASRAARALSRNVTVGHVVSIWAAMMENASQAPVRGELLNWSDEDIGAALDIPEDEVKAIRIAMQGKTLECDRLTAWKRRQPKAEDATAAERKRAQRERDRQADVTAQQVESRHVTEGHDRGEERRKEEKEQMPPTSSAAAPVPPVSGDSNRPDKTPKRNGTRLPEDWRPTPELIAAARAERPDIDLRLETAKFRDHWHAKTGRDATKLDWDATYRNWIRNARSPNGFAQRVDPPRHREELRR
ncbi:hypothetical protein [Luteibacter sp. SG786]|uniref:hypothetical protein n=1 Tax=Luteibacter sp. SG786 TaxID=2587130 RepID=UPI00141F6B78|nr:hypothetical protein [Luteibacter sp. SG786]NII53563.1 Ni/Co efflux regulator RcnB [Luteibacter sp. SG786]